MKVVFQTIKFKNFLAVGNEFLEITLNKNPTTLLYGSNFQGKSTILDALTFVLFGKPYRDINKPQLVNTINQQECVVEVEFVVGNKKYRVVRGIKPNIFEIYQNGKLIDQDARIKDYQQYFEDHIIHFNFKVFKQIVVLGSRSFIPFMKLDGPTRRSVVEDLLDIQIFSKMLKSLKQKISINEDTIDQIKSETRNTKEKIDLQTNNIKRNNQQNQTKINSNLAEIAKGKETIKALEEKISVAREKITDLLSITKPKVRLEEKLQKFSPLGIKMDHNIEMLHKNTEFFQKHDTCFTCDQPIEDSFKSKRIAENLKKLEGLKKGKEEISFEIGKIYEDLKQIGETQKQIQGLQEEIASNTQTIKHIGEWEQKLVLENKQIQKLTHDEERDNTILKNLEKDLRKSNREYEHLISLIPYHDTALLLLKDSGIKAEIIKHYLPVINKYVNQYLSYMDFNTNINFDENFEPIILARHRDTFSYGSFSEGEKLRIDLAMLFTWRNVAKLKNSVDTNILFLDEIIDSALDNTGMEDFFKLLKNFQDDNIFVISPKGDTLIDKFSHAMKFVKVGNFTEIVEDE